MNPRTYTIPGFQDVFTILRNDGRPNNPDSRYIVFNYTGKDPNAVAAIQKYADEAQASGNAQFADDLRAALKNPTDFPAQTGVVKSIFVVRHNDRVVAKAAETYEAACGLAGFDPDDAEVSLVSSEPLHTIFAKEES